MVLLPVGEGSDLVEYPSTWASKSRRAKPCTGVRQILSLFRYRLRCVTTQTGLLNWTYVQVWSNARCLGRVLCLAESPRCLESLELACNMAASDSESSMSGVDVTITAVHPSPRDPTTGDEFDGQEWRLLSLSAELLSSLLALSPLFPPSGRLSAELSSSFFACSPFLFDDDDDDHTKDWPTWKDRSPLLRGVCVCVHPDSKLRVLARHVLCAVVEAGGHPYHLSWMPNEEGSGW